MKKTEWFYEPDTHKWWMVTVATNADEIPTIHLPKKNLKKHGKAIVRNINLADENKKLWWTVLGLVGALGAALALCVVLLIA